MPLFTFPKDSVRAEYVQGRDAAQFQTILNRTLANASEANVADISLAGAGAGRDFMAEILFTDSDAGAIAQPVLAQDAAFVFCFRDTTPQGLTAQVARGVAQLVADGNVTEIHAIVHAGSSDAQTYMAIILFAAPQV